MKNKLDIKAALLEQRSFSSMISVLLKQALTQQQIIQAAKNNSGTVFGNQGEFEKVDIAGMTLVLNELKGLVGGVNGADTAGATIRMDSALASIAQTSNATANSIATLNQNQKEQQNLGVLNINMTTDMGMIAGKIWGADNIFKQAKNFCSSANKQCSA